MNNDTQSKKANNTEKKLEIKKASSYLSDGGFDNDIQYFAAYKDRKIGFSQIDKYLTLYPGLAVLGGQSSLGKTTFAVNICDKLLERGETVLFFSLEQLPIEIQTKSLSRIVADEDPYTRLTNSEIKNGAKSDELDDAREKYIELSKNCYYITGDFHTTAKDIVECVEQFIREHDRVRPVVIIDYLQLIAAPEQFRGSIRECVDENLKALKDLQKRNGLFMIVISSFNRGSNLEPVSYESFKESSMIEYTCDYVWGLQLAILDEENKNFYVKKGQRGGTPQQLIQDKLEMINRAKDTIPKKVEFVSLKSRNGRQFYKAFFDYYPANDRYVETNDKGYSSELKSWTTEDDDIPFL